MGSAGSSPKNIDLNDFCNEILSAPVSLTKYTKILKRNPDWLEENCSYSVKEHILLQLIDISCMNTKYIYVMESVINILEGGCITDAVFGELINFPDTDVREGLKIALAHKSLTESQLLLLCESETIFECFFELAIFYYNSPNCSFDKFREFMERFCNSKFSYLYDELLFELLNQNISDKQKADWLEREKNRNF